jgi:hypothetical protein
MSNASRDRAQPVNNAAHKAASKVARARDGELAMAEYRAQERAMLAKTERLRALRLANAAGEPPPADTKVSRKGRGKGR